MCGGFTAEVQQARRQLPQPPADRMAVLVDHDDVVVVVQRQDGDRAVVLDDFAARDVAVRHPDLVGAQRENVSDVEGFGVRPSRSRVQPRAAGSCSSCATLSAMLGTVRPLLGNVHARQSFFGLVVQRRADERRRTADAAGWAGS